jgi:hypothetical protein
MLGKQISRERVETPDKEMPAQLFECPAGRVGKLNLEVGTPVAAMDLRRIREKCGEEVFGVLGMDWLKRYKIRIDRERNEVQFLKFVDKDAGKPVSITYDHLCPFVHMNIRGLDKPELVLVDTGECGRIDGSLRKEAFEVLEKAGRLRNVRTISSQTAGGRVTCRSGLLEAIEWTGDRHVSLRLGESDCSSIGMSYVCQHVVLFDFPGSMMYVKKGSRFKDPAVELSDRSGLEIVRRGGKLVAESVRTMSPAFDAGIRSGDTIVSVDDKNTAAIPIQLLADRLCEKGIQIRMVVSGSGGDREVVLRLK